MKILHVSAWAKAFTQFRMPMIEELAKIATRQAIYCPDKDHHYNRLIDLGFEVMSGPVSKHFNPKVLSDVHRLKRLLRREDFDVVIAHQPMGALVGITAAKWAGTPVRIYSTGGLKYVPDATGLSNGLMKHGEAAIMHWSDVVLLVNKEDEATLQSMSVSNSKIRYVGPRGGCGIDTKVFSPATREQFYSNSRAELGLRHDHIAIGFVGRCVWEKGLRELMVAAKTLIKDEFRKNLRFCIFGRGAALSDLKEMAESSGIAENFIFPGYLSPIHQYVAAFDIFILPSYREGLPISLLESQAMGIASIATDVRGCRELVNDGETGLLVKCRDPAAIADALRQLIDSPSESAKLAANALQNIHANYSQAALLPRTMQIIQSTIARALN